MDLMANALFCCNVLPAKRLTETWLCSVISTT
jgi:hypothetical protein